MKNSLQPLKIEYDQSADVVTIDGVKYSGDFFRFTRWGTEGALFEIQRSADKTVKIGRFHLEGLLRFIVTHWWKQ